MSVPADHHHTDPVRQIQVPESGSALKVVICHSVVPEDTHLVRNLHAESLYLRILVVAEIQTFGHRREGHALGQKRKKGYDEDDIEYLISSLQTGYYRI